MEQEAVINKAQS
ncbi:hypothetical protein ECEC4196_5586, partial [Escherichia coli EC4196]